jgi:hypothetical protein
MNSTPAQFPGGVYTPEQINAGADTFLANVPSPILVNMGNNIYVLCPAGQYQLNIEVMENWFFSASGGTSVPGVSSETAGIPDPNMVYARPGQGSRSPLLVQNALNQERLAMEEAAAQVEYRAFDTCEPSSMELEMEKGVYDPYKGLDIFTLPDTARGSGGS